MKKKFTNKSRRANPNKEIARLKRTPLLIGPSLKLNTIDLEIDAQLPIYQRTAQTAYSFSPGSQVYWINLANTIAVSNNFLKYISAGTPTFEFIQVSGFTLSWFPTEVQPVSTTFELPTFSFRYFPAYSVDSVLPSGYNANFNKTNIDMLINQTSSQQTRTFILNQLPSYIVSEGNRQVLGQVINGYNFYNYASSHGGILTLIQPIPSVNSVATYNPRIGTINLKFHCIIYNSVV